ncbi:MAG: hypothetical protein AAFN78_02655 [Pseudomonadota bacterium]
MTKRTVVFVLLVPLLLAACRDTGGRRGQRGGAGSDPATIVDRLDRNGDGAISRDEVPSQAARLRDNFDVIDADGDGRITAAELEAVQQYRAGRDGSTPGQSSPPASPPPADTSYPPSDDAGEWRADARAMGRSGVDYIDPEILSSENLVASQDKSGNVWLGRLDPKTGLFVDNGQDVRMATNALRVGESYNGPEFGVDASGWAVYYTTMNDGVPQIGRARLVNGEPVAEVLTKDSQRRQSVLASKNPSASDTTLAYLHGSLRGGEFYWADRKRLSSENRLMPISGVDGPRFVDDSDLFVYTETRGSGQGQVKLVDRTTGAATQVTDDAGTKAWAYGWRAPEFDNDMLVLALVDRSELVVWRDTGGRYWQRIATFGPPAGARHGYMGSPEPFVSEGKSYISLVLKDKRGTPTDSEVWVIGLNADGDEPFARRVDSGVRGLARSDPETYRGDDEIFLIYNIITPRRTYEIYRASTGLSSSP